MKQISTNKDVLSVMEVAELLGICRSKAYELVNKEGFPRFKIGKTIRIRKLSLMKWIEINLEAA